MAVVEVTAEEEFFVEISLVGNTAKP
jgi:hypothetical protein